MRYAPPADATITVREGRDRLYVSWTADDADAFRDVKDAFRQYFPGRDASWSPDERAWAIPRHLQPRLERWLAAHARPDCVHWERQSGRYERYERPQSAAVGSVDQAYKVLHLLPSAPPEVVKAAHHALIKLHHPDAGGDHHAAVAVNQAVDVIRACGRLEAAS